MMTVQVLPYPCFILSAWWKLAVQAMSQPLYAPESTSMSCVMRLGGSWSRSRRVRKNSPPSGFGTPKHPALIQSLCHLRYFNWLIKRTHWYRCSCYHQDNRHRTELYFIGEDHLGLSVQTAMVRIYLKILWSQDRGGSAPRRKGSRSEREA